MQCGKNREAGKFCLFFLKYMFVRICAVISLFIILFCVTLHRTVCDLYCMPFVKPITSFTFIKYPVLVTLQGGVFKQKFIHEKVNIVCKQFLNVKRDLIYVKYKTFNFKMIFFLIKYYVHILFFTLPELTRARNCCCSECRRNCGCSEYPTYFVYFSPLKADEFFGDGFSISFFIFSKFSKIEHQKHKYKSFELF